MTTSNERENSARVDRVDSAIDKLTIISANLDKLLGIHEERLNKHDKRSDNFEAALEKRREVVDNSISDIYETMRKEDRQTAKELEEQNKELKKELTETKTKLGALEKSIWIYGGGLSVIIFILTYGQSFFKLLSAVSK